MLKKILLSFTIAMTALSMLMFVIPLIPLLKGDFQVHGGNFFTPLVTLLVCIGMHVGLIGFLVSHMKDKKNRPVETLYPDTSHSDETPTTALIPQRKNPSIQITTKELNTIDVTTNQNLPDVYRHDKLK